MLIDTLEHVVHQILEHVLILQLHLFLLFTHVNLQLNFLGGGWCTSLVGGSNGTTNLTGVGFPAILEGAHLTIPDLLLLFFELQDFLLLFGHLSRLDGLLLFLAFDVLTLLLEVQTCPPIQQYDARTILVHHDVTHGIEDAAFVLLDELG